MADFAEILYLDNHLLVINKPAGLLSQADDTGDLDVVTAAKAYLKARFNKPGQVFVGLVHRLDRPASGVMVLARTSKAAARLSEQFRKGEPKKRYLALVEGVLTGTGTLSDYLQKQDQRVSIVSATTSGAKSAVLSWRSLFTNQKFTLLEVELLTGRSHQIRVQLAHQGHPIIGDLRYGAKTKFDGRNLALHCRQLTLSHPTKQEEMSWTANLPETWQKFIGPAQADRL